jgi:hypothetical protein
VQLFVIISIFDDIENKKSIYGYWELSLTKSKNSEGDKNRIKYRNWLERFEQDSREEKN